MMKAQVRIFVTDDHKLLLDGLATLIQSIEGLELAGKFYTGAELIGALDNTNHLPDICLVDIEMPGMDGIETVKIIRQKFPRLKVMALTMHDEFHFVSRMIAAGANGYLLKNVDREVFEKTIHRILAGESFLSPGLKTKALSLANEDELSTREQQVLRLIAKGKSNKEIGEELFISDRTADTHKTNIKRKLKINTLAQVIEYAKKHGYY
jgi:DNA-binding NarL/FixJ family response regulator